MLLIQTSLKITEMTQSNNFMCSAEIWQVEILKSIYFPVHLLARPQSLKSRAELMHHLLQRFPTLYSISSGQTPQHNNEQKSNKK